MCIFHIWVFDMRGFEKQEYSLKRVGLVFGFFLRDISMLSLAVEIDVALSWLHCGRLHLAVERTAVISPFHLIVLSLGKLSPIHHAKASVKSWSGWVSGTTVWFLRLHMEELSLHCFLKQRRNVPGLAAQIVISPLLLFLRNLLHPLMPVILPT